MAKDTISHLYGSVSQPVACSFT